MASKSSGIADRLRSDGRGLLGYVKRVEKLHSDDELFKVDVERAYAGAYLLFYTSLERALERLCIGIMTQSLTIGQKGISPIVAVPNERIARQVLSGDRSYVDWLPFDRFAKRRAKAFLVKGKPFTDVPRPDSRFLATMGIVRNALAHGSPHSLRLFREEVIDGGAIASPVPSSQRKPAPYLRGSHAIGQSRFEFHLAEAAAIMQRLCA